MVGADTYPKLVQTDARKGARPPEQKIRQSCIGTPSSCMPFPACYIAGTLCRPIFGLNRLQQPCSDSLGVRSLVYPSRLYSVTPPRGRSPGGSHQAPQRWVAEGLRTGRPTTRGNRRTPLAPATNPGRVARAANGAPAGDDCHAGYALGSYP